jgi:predicted CoA-binding protein
VIQLSVEEVTEIVDIFELFFNSKVVDTIVEDINRYAEQFLRLEDHGVILELSLRTMMSNIGSEA